MSKMQRTKGATFEREIANDLTESWGVKVKRNLGQARDSGDDITVPPFRIECKRRKGIAVYEWLEQCEMACYKVMRREFPVVIARADHKEPIVIMRYSDWKRIAAGELE
jgi:Holliday junction resolvase